MNSKLILVLISVLLLTSHARGDDEDFRVNELIYRQNSLYRNILVIKNKTHICMSFGKKQGMQSCTLINRPDYLVLNYTKALAASLYFKPNAKRVLIIGMGGGSLPKALRAFRGDISIDTVELDAAVESVAHTFFGFTTDANSRVHIGDGRMFVRAAIRKQQKYDIVMIDAFDKDYIPEHMLTREFLEQVKSVLTDEGIVAANTFTGGPLSQSELATYQSVFGEIYSIPVRSGNRVLFAGRSHLQPLTAAQGRAVKPDVNLTRQGVDPSILDALSLELPATGARVFTDQYSPANLMLNSK
ncbi:spermidine synthase [Pseudomonas savastanoi]|uniref:spermidine synthase n=1 Tax=Pseudomonas savastanoi TaxID=29438 RepID=UPI00177E3C72|nr:fused MFS/spermidine synthase [Pseudomonas savastanoi]QOI07878.1 hypothetical protein D5S10_29555 [Pseudomonas savastanoi]